MSKFLDLEGLQSVVSKMKSLINERAQDYEITSEYPMFAIYANNKNGIYRLTGNYSGDVNLFYRKTESKTLSGPGWKNSIFYITKDSENPDNYSYFFGWSRETNSNDEDYNALTFYWGIASENDPDNKARCYSYSLENSDNKVTSLLSTATDYEYPSAKAVYDQLVLKEVTANKTTSLSSSSTDIQYPSAKAVYDEINSKISSVYKAKGTCTFANKPALIADNEGFVYNISDAFTTTADFVEGAGKSYPAGTNIIVINNGTAENPDWKYDVLAGMTDLSGYVKKNGDTMTGLLTVPKLIVGSKKEGTNLGSNATILGYNNGASGNYSVAEGNHTTASGSYSHAEGQYTETNGSSTHAEGSYTRAKGTCSHSEGNYTLALGNYSHAEGGSSAVSPIILSGKAATTIYTTAATGNIKIGSTIWYNGLLYSVTAVVANTSITLDRTLSSDTALENVSVYFYNSSAAIGEHSHAENVSVARGDFSHSEGLQTIAKNRSQHVEGEFNIEDTSTSSSANKGKYLHIAGNGTSETARSNAYTLDWSGNAWFKGDVYIKGTNQTTGSKKLATEEYVEVNGGKINSISLNGAPQTIDANKNVDLSTPQILYGETEPTSTFTAPAGSLYCVYG